MTDDLVIEARKGGPCAELGDRCRAIEAASGCFCAAVADRIEALTAERDLLREALEGAESWLERWEVTAEMVKTLREKTGAGMWDAKRALAECWGDMDEAVEWLRYRGTSHTYVPKYKRYSAVQPDAARLREAAIALRDDMLERSQLRIDAINGEQYRIVNAGAGVWMDFCAAPKGETP